MKFKSIKCLCIDKKQPVGATSDKVDNEGNICIEMGLRYLELAQLDNS